MKSTQIISIALAALFMACGTSKKSTTTVTKTPEPISNNLVLPAPSNTNYAPGEAELNAIKTQFSDITMANLNEGYTIYSKGACIKCHESENIYKYNEESWKKIIDNMSKKAYLNPEQKDAVYKYVMSIKATQPAETK